MSKSDRNNTDTSELPPISILLAIRNEQRHLEDCLQSLVEQDYPTELVEILLIDGMSTDRTPEIVKRWSDRDSRIQAFGNPKQIVSTGMNLGIAEARHDLILWVSGHAMLEPDHLKKSVATMQRTGAAAVGGVLRTIGQGGLGKANAAALSSPFGVGRGAHRVGTQSGWVPTVTMALYRKEAIVAAGGFNESLPRNQDNDLHARMNSLGLKSYIDIEIKPTYICRDSLSGLLTQAWNNGFWNIAVMRMGGRGFSLRHFVPLAFVLSLVLLVALACLWPLGKLLLPVAAAAYGASAVVASLVAAIRHRLTWQIVILPLLFLALHLTYGAASWAALMKPRAGESISG